MTILYKRETSSPLAALWTGVAERFLPLANDAISNLCKNTPVEELNYMDGIFDILTIVP